MQLCFLFLLLCFALQGRCINTAWLRTVASTCKHSKGHSSNLLLLMYCTFRKLENSQGTDWKRKVKAAEAEISWLSRCVQTESEKSLRVENVTTSAGKKSILWKFFTDVQILSGNKVKKKNFWVQSEAELNANTEVHSYLLTRSVQKLLLSLQLMHSWCTECLGRPNIPVVKFVWMKQAGNSLRILSEHTFSPLVRVEIQNHGILHFP